MPEAAPRPVPSPAAGRLVALADRCVQCGLCLPACPTYGLDRLETESPRGRIALARGWELGLADPTPVADLHLDHCLGCRRCEVVCPAGVEYGPLLVEARARQRTRRPPGLRQRAVESLVRHPRLLAALLGLYRRLFPVLPAGLRPLPRPPAEVPGEVAPATGATVALFLGCVARSYEPPVRAALHRLAAAAGVAVAEPPGQGCCGSLHAHAGDLATAARLAEANRAAFGGAATVLTLASGCHEAVAAARPEAETRDAVAFIAALGDRLAFRDTRRRVALHLPCTQRNVVRSDGATRALLGRIPGLEVVELTAGYGCCGAAGTAMLAEPQRAAAYRAPLLAQLEASGASVLLSANVGCRLHLAGGTGVPVQHPLEFLAQCLA